MTEEEFEEAVVEIVNVSELTNAQIAEVLGELRKRYPDDAEEEE